MIDGIRLTLMIGPAVPVPVPGEVLEALDSVVVNTYAGDVASGFELTFSLEKNSPLNTVFLVGGGNVGIPIIRVLLVVTINNQPSTLIDGVVTEHNVQPGSEGKPSTLSIRGADLTAVMDYIDFDGIPYPAMPHAARVALVVAKYAGFGIVPIVIPSFVQDFPLPTDRIPRHKGSDLNYVKILAQEAGYIFYMEPGPAPGTTFAYWGPEIRVGVPQPALTVDMDAHTNVESLSFTYAKENKEIPVVYIHEKMSKAIIPIPIPDVSPLKPPLGVVPPLPPKIRHMTDTARLSPTAAILAGVAQADSQSDVITARGDLNVLRYGHVLKSRRLVGLRGAGIAFDGLYFVDSVTHNISRGSYKQSFTVKRDRLLPNVPMVPP